MGGGMKHVVTPDVNSPSTERTAYHSEICTHEYHTP